ncbi:phytanoyl-CoA dioxygenase family protein [Noviherbaspirillum aerium]|uniref:phytanoyl-CoA dioxygenase family protein n=1 Tax=Noviherbaspirillum aerium TaxID=2588497 RepID=UPI00124D1F01|nr:phytanoyl-CoA dioxygenase family protein [Noviherbaspirillum aerium]
MSAVPATKEDWSRARAHEPMLSAAQIEDYRAAGFLTMRNVFDPTLLQRLTATIDRLWSEGSALGNKTRHFDLDPAHGPGNPRIRRISSPTELDDVFIEVAFDSVLGDIAADLIGGAVKFYHSKVNFKLPDGGAEIGWHQDWPVFPHTNTNIVALSIPINPSRSGNGCLQTVPGSHMQGPRSHWVNGKYALNCNAGMSEEDFARVVDNELDPGDVVAHHGLAVHGSSANLSDMIRTTYIIQYVAADAFAYTAPVIDSRHRNRMVRGEPARYARVEQGLIELPPDFSAGYTSIYSLQESNKR